MRRAFFVVLTSFLAATAHAQSGNVGIGTTTPLQKLDIAQGRLRFSGDQSPALVQGIEFTNAAGTVLNGFVGKFNDSTIGLFGYTGAGWRFLFNNTNGNIGLQGNTNPRAPLSFASVNGSKIALFGNADAAHYGIGISPAAIQLYTSAVTEDILFGYGSSAAFTERMRVRGNGNVGIGTAGPAQKLDIFKGRLRFTGDPTPGAVSQGIEFTNTAGTALNGFVGGYNDSMMGLYGFTGAGWQFLFNNTNGNVGLQGNSNPRAPLSFANYDGNKIALFGNASGAHYGIGISPAAIQIYTSAASEDILFGYGSSVAFTERMRVKGNGNVGIGTNNPQYKLDVSGDFRTTSNASVQGSVQVGGSVIANTVQVQGGNPAAGKVLTATNSSGNAVWKKPEIQGSSFHGKVPRIQPMIFYPSGAIIVIPFRTDTIPNTFDHTAAFNNATHSFTVPSTGVYHFDVSIYVLGTALYDNEAYLMAYSGANLLAQTKARYSTFYSSAGSQLTMSFTANLLANEIVGFDMYVPLSGVNSFWLDPHLSMVSCFKLY